MKSKTKYAVGFLIGVINSLIGACGGIITVAALKKDDMGQTEAHANAIAIILPLTVISSIFYIYKGYSNISDALIFIPGGVVGAVVGGLILPKIPQKILKKLFAIFIIWAGVRMVIK